MAIPYFCDEQFRRVLIQITRIFNGFQYQYIDTNGNNAYKTIPSLYALTNKQAGSMLTSNSENTMQTFPLFVTYPKSIDLSSERRQNPTYVRENHVTEREIVNGEYTDKSGSRYTVKTMMPVPIDLRVRVELITTNQNQKYQMLEQIIVLFNPEVEIQTSVNALDWTAITYARLEDILISPANSVLGESTSYDITAFDLYIPTWINPPAKISRQKLIQEVIINIDSYDDTDEIPEAGQLLSETVVTPGEYSIKVSSPTDGTENYTIQLVDNGDSNYNHDWNKLLEAYGKVNCCSKLLLLPEITAYSNNIDVISGNIKAISEDGKNLLWSLNDTSLPQNKFKDNIIDGIINPENVHPQNGLPVSDGITYMLLSNIAQNDIWGKFYYNNVETQAQENDVIRWDENSSKWNIIMKASETVESVFYTVKTSSSNQYITFENGDWRITIDAEYSKGFWRLRL